MPTLEIALPRLHRSQRMVRDNPARFKVLACGRRWGKTRLGVALCLEAASRGLPAWWIAPSFPIAMIGWRQIRKLVHHIPGAVIREGTLTAHLPGKGWIGVKSSDNPDSLRGEGLGLAVFDEAAFQVEEAWQEAVRPALSDLQGKAIFFSTPQGRNWFWRLWARGQSGDPEWASWQLPTSDNPFINPAEIEAARLGGMAERAFAQEYLADFSLSEGVFFPEWSEAKHVIPVFDIPKDWIRWVAVDWGFADPFCALWFARSPDRKRVVAYRELYERGLREDQQAKLIKIASGDERIQRYVGDPSMWNKRVESDRPSIASIYIANGVPLQPAGNSRVSGWQICRAGLAGIEPRFQAMGRCRNLLRTLPEMLHDRLNVEDLADKINGVKTEDHSVDAWRYGMVEEAQPGVTHSKVPFTAGAKPPDKLHWAQAADLVGARRA